jgi:hypothetical protein
MRRYEISSEALSVPKQTHAKLPAVMIDSQVINWEILAASDIVFSRHSPGMYLKSLSKAMNRFNHAAGVSRDIQT